MIDHQWHWLPPEYVEILKSRSSAPRLELVEGALHYESETGDGAPLPPPLFGKLEDHFEVAAEHGIDTIVCAPVPAGDVLRLDPDEAAGLLVDVNAAIGRAQRDHPERFVGLATLPIQDPTAAIEVLDRAAEDQLRGVSLLASIDGAPLATEATLPVFKRIEEHGLPIFLHPAMLSPTSSQRLGMRAEIGLGWMYHTALSVVQLIDNGTLDACPGLTIVHPHLGGVLPYVLGRMERIPGTEPIAPYLKKHFYTDTVSATPGALAMAIETYGIDRVLFGTDYPFIPIEPGIGFVRQNASEADAATIFGNVLPGLGVAS